MDMIHSLNLFLSLLLITNPLLALPIILNLTHKLSRKQRLQLSARTIFFSIAILWVMTWAGNELFNLIGIQLVALQLTGGLIVLGIAMALIQTNVRPLESLAKMQGNSCGSLAPLAFPLIAGPAAISLVTVAAAKFPAATDGLIISGITLLVLLIDGIVLYAITCVAKASSTMTICLVNKIGGFILMAIGIQMILNGVTDKILSIQSPPSPPVASHEHYEIDAPTPLSLKELGLF